MIETSGDVVEKAAIVRSQLRFLREKKAGCLFAATAARDPLKYGWHHEVLASPSARRIDDLIRAAIRSSEATTLSIVLPTVASAEDLVRLIRTLVACRKLVLELRENFRAMTCFGFRARVGRLRSYVTGFADLPFMPKTRRTPFAEITMRVKPRPNYEFVFKEAPPGVIHLADLDMKGMRRGRLWALWRNSFVETEGVLGAKPDLRSAARTTFALPMAIAKLIP